MKILHVIDSLNIGGAENLLVNYLLYTKKNSEIHNDLCILYDSKTFLYHKLLDRNINIFDLNLKNKYDLRVIFKLIKLINKNKYDIVHVHLFPAQYFCAIASLFTKKVEYVFTEHSSFNRRRKYKVFKLFDNLSYLMYKKIICVSEMAKNDLVKWIPSLSNKALVIYNGIPIEKIVERQKIYDILLVGSLRSNVKGVDILLKSLKLIEDKITKVAIAGDGILKDDLIKLRNALKLDDKVDFLGNRRDIDILLEQTKIFVLPSRWEGLPISLLEAMSKAKPIIASNVGGIPELIRDGESGILVEPENELELANAIEKLLNDTEYAEYLGKNAYKDAINRFSIEVYINNLTTLYKSLIK
ncbi:Glycosyltransferase involved in cell wall bisynthesis [Caldanaerobius fijiensis DSM 17918]|uniref:Glycosyltransferase involved in cell wall bisynthesis n=1 Tax=Caldanaerobius fijiensis DSM 17918 TaxID=1121256 RepID=A0A1M5CA92_9THEO|nr:glycosyltransferase [Caldanaerobius fijiensis]SHF51684.1 Glycosyltransferase involved in cell wall bisynthesis [Caldanaerobius fijiensis DSM 17918]